MANFFLKWKAEKKYTELYLFILSETREALKMHWPPTESISNQEFNQI